MDELEERVLAVKEEAKVKSEQALGLLEEVASMTGSEYVSAFITEKHVTLSVYPTSPRYSQPYISISRQRGAASNRGGRSAVRE